MNGTASYATRAEGLAVACHEIRPDVPWLTPSEFLEQSRGEQWTVVDVRTPPERKVSMIPGAMSKEVFEAHLDKHTGRNILVYCTAGCRSGAYAEELRQRGLNAFNLRGGVLAWALNGGWFVSPGGQGTRRVHVYGEPWNVLAPEYEAVR